MYSRIIVARKGSGHASVLAKLKCSLHCSMLTNACACPIHGSSLSCLMTMLAVTVWKQKPELWQLTKMCTLVCICSFKCPYNLSCYRMGCFLFFYMRHCLPWQHSRPLPPQTFSTRAAQWQGSLYSFLCVINVVLIRLGTVHIWTGTGTWNFIPVPNNTFFYYFILSVITEKNIYSLLKKKREKKKEQVQTS